MLVAAPAPRGRRNVLGHFAPLRWRAADAADALHEVAVTAEHLNRDAKEIVATLLHEAAHALNFARGIRDCSANQYHNRNFATACNEIGLWCEQVANYGFAYTRLIPVTEDAYAAEIALLDSVLMHRDSGWNRSRDEGSDGASGPEGDAGTSTPTRTPRPGRMVRAECSCRTARGRVKAFRIARSIFEMAPISCGGCGEEFRLAE